jgi:hypothetical protein
VAPDVVLERRHVEVADQNCALVRGRAQLRHAVKLVEEGELVGELLVDGRIGLVAAGRHIEIVHRDRVAQAGSLAERHRNVAAVGLAAIIVDRDALERQAREHRDAVIALLPVQRRMDVAEALEALERKGVVRAFRLLQADHVGRTALM